MDFNLIQWLIIFVSHFLLLAVLVYQIICLSDLEADYMNPYESAEKINAIIVSEFIVQGLVCVVFLICGRWIMFLLSLPLACYHLGLYLKQEHLLDVTEIFRALSREKQLRFQKLGVYLFFFFITIVRLIIAVYNSLVDEEEAVRSWML
ncbi:hypothetical protein Droror1_Dr00002457 [Drosera rotundifolia]